MHNVKTMHCFSSYLLYIYIYIYIYIYHCTLKPALKSVKTKTLLYRLFRK